MIFNPGAFLGVDFMPFIFLCAFWEPFCLNGKYTCSFRENYKVGSFGRNDGWVQCIGDVTFRLDPVSVTRWCNYAPGENQENIHTRANSVCHSWTVQPSYLSQGWRRARLECVRVSSKHTAGWLCVLCNRIKSTTGRCLCFASVYTCDDRDVCVVFFTLYLVYVCLCVCTCSAKWWVSKGVVVIRCGLCISLKLGLHSLYTNLSFPLKCLKIHILGD